jgi:hypothetical protein
MTLNAAQSVVTTGTTPTPYTATASDTIAASDIDPGGGVFIRVVTTGTIVVVTVLDPNLTIQGNPAAAATVTTVATGVKYIFVPPSAVNRNTGVATVTFVPTTGCTYDLLKSP